MCSSVFKEPPSSCGWFAAECCEEDCGDELAAGEEFECADVVSSLFPKLQERLKKHSDRSITRQGIKLKFADFNQTTVELQSQECDLDFFLNLLKKALSRADNRGIRLVGLTLGFAEKEQGHSQLSLPI